MGGLADYEGVLVAHADKGEYHGCLFDGALPEGLEASHEDDIENVAPPSSALVDFAGVLATAGLHCVAAVMLCPGAVTLEVAHASTALTHQRCRLRR